MLICLNTVCLSNTVSIRSIVKVNRLMKKILRFFNVHLCPPMASAEIYPGGQKRHFAYPFQVVDDVTQIDVHKTLYPFCAMKKMLIVTATVAVFPPRKFTLGKCLC